MRTTKKITKRQLQAMETRNKLFETAKQLFMKHGFETVTIDEIVEEAGTSKGAFYTHFKSKDQILLEQFKEIDNYYLEIYKKIKRRRKAGNQLLAFVKAQHHYIAEVLGIDFIKTVYSSHINNSIDYLNEVNRPLYAIVEEIISKGQQKGEFRTDKDAAEMTMAITRCMRGTIYDWCVRNGEFDIVQDGYSYFQLIIDSLKKND